MHLIARGGDSNGRFKKHCGFLLGSGLTLVLDHIQVDGRCWTTKTDSGKLRVLQPQADQQGSRGAGRLQDTV